MTLFEGEQNGRYETDHLHMVLNEHIDFTEEGLSDDRKYSIFNFLIIILLLFLLKIIMQCGNVDNCDKFLGEKCSLSLLGVVVACS